MTITKFAHNVIAEIEAEFGIIDNELKTVIIPDGLKLGNALLRLVSSPAGEFVLDQFIDPTIVAKGETYIKEAIAGLTEAQDILALPTASEQLAELAKWLQSQPELAKHMWVEKLVSTIIKLQHGSKLPEHVYDSLAQLSVTNSKITTGANISATNEAKG